MIPPFSHIGSRRHSPNYYEFAGEAAPPSNLMAALGLFGLIVVLAVFPYNL